MKSKHTFLDDEPSNVRPVMTLANMPHVFSDNTATHMAGSNCYCLGQAKVLPDNSASLAKCNVKVERQGDTFFLFFFFLIK